MTLGTYCFGQNRTPCRYGVKCLSQRRKGPNEGMNRMEWSSAKETLLHEKSFLFTVEEEESLLKKMATDAQIELDEVQFHQKTSFQSKCLSSGLIFCKE